MKGGSHSYGLATPSSDIDWRGVYVHTSVSALVGLDKDTHKENQKDGVDEVYKEFRETMRLLRGANTMAVELLYNQAWDLITPEWNCVIEKREQLVDSEKLFSCLRGYMQGELKLANGERTGKLGGKRKEAIDKYGFSPKNFVQMFRLSWAGQIYFQKGYFPVNVPSENSSFAKLLLRIKTQPELYTKQALNNMAEESEEWLVKAYESRKFTTTFNENLANELCLKIYGPSIARAYMEIPYARAETPI